MNRRKFIKAMGGMSLSASPGLSPFLMDLHAFQSKANLSKIEAKFYKKLPNREIECTLCPRMCKLGDKERGYCGVRENQGGIYYTLVYGKACAIHVDPVEKKPFFHFLPGKQALSIASAGCNVNCKFCQNCEISQVRPEQIQQVDFPPPAVVRAAKNNNCPIIAYTYSEPIVFFEYMYDTSIEARRERIKNVVITGGHVNGEPLIELMKVVDGIKVDLKAFNQDFYTKYVRGELKPVLDAIKQIAQNDTWLEIVYLVIPTLNDSPAEIQNLCRLILNEVGPDVPIHFSRFHPMYLLKNLPPTPLSTLEKIHAIALKEGLHYAYIGNVPGHKSESTFCPKCQSIVVRRRGYQIQGINMIKDKCRTCSNPIPGVWS
jgi:pyruvate formate lyase activating enzyme